jgi:hypothetical protein
MSSKKRTATEIFQEEIRNDAQELLRDGTVIKYVNKSCGCTDIRFKDGTGIKIGSKECIEGEANTSQEAIALAILSKLPAIYELSSPKKTTTEKN